jgi:hypothetical protein
MKFWNLAWFAWLCTGITLEALAIYSRNPGAPLSEHVWVAIAEYPILTFAIGLMMGHFFWQRIR